MYYLVPLGYKDTLQVMSYFILMKNIAIWPYKEISLWPYYALLLGVRYPKTHLSALTRVGIGCQVDNIHPGHPIPHDLR